MLCVVSASGRELQRIPVPFKDEPSSIFPAPGAGGSRVCLVQRDGTVIIFDLQLKCCVCVFEPPLQSYSQHQVGTACISPCGRYLAAGSGRTFLYDLVNCTRLRELPVSGRVAFARSSSEKAESSGWHLLCPAPQGVVWMPLLPRGGFSEAERARVLTDFSMVDDQLCFACDDEVLVSVCNNRIYVLCIETCKYSSASPDLDIIQDDSFRGRKRHPCHSLVAVRLPQPMAAALRATAAEAPAATSNPKANITAATSSDGGVQEGPASESLGSTHEGDTNMSLLACTIGRRLFFHSLERPYSAPTFVAHRDTDATLLAFSPDARYLAAALKHEVELWSLSPTPAAAAVVARVAVTDAPSDLVCLQAVQHLLHGVPCFITRARESSNALRVWAVKNTTSSTAASAEEKSAAETTTTTTKTTATTVSETGGKVELECVRDFVTETSGALSVAVTPGDSTAAILSKPVANGEEVLGIDGSERKPQRAWQQEHVYTLELYDLHAGKSLRTVQLTSRLTAARIFPTASQTDFVAHLGGMAKRLSLVRNSAKVVSLVDRFSSNVIAIDRQQRLAMTTNTRQSALCLLPIGPAIAPATVPTLYSLRDRGVLYTEVALDKDVPKNWGNSASNNDALRCWHRVIH